MKYLLDVNALIAWYHGGTPKQRFHAWRAANAPATTYHTCAITELGFLRVSMIRYNFTREMAENALALIKRDITGYIDTLPSPTLANWVLSHAQTTDSYLCQLAAANGMKLATFDTKITDKAAAIIP